MPEECAHLTRVVIRELKANGFQIVRKQDLEARKKVGKTLK